MIQLLRSIIQAIQPFLVPICFFVAWGFIILLSWTLWSIIRDTATKAKQMHQIPCANCQFFTNDYHLKCTVQPTLANTEQAIGCSDYRPG
ncbi:hypothetical protein NIES593_06200 [Hydrococcus rivularis NIES-593]|uniref:Uncharacterized protein n=1 Tax=Hydrococcus rivularis NIES-593 TaxID=1921803 RepID=A0A1U7HMJ3_9CYAN|nr:hypothetical protein [Hydrococcus rivularis]OKH24806.1 hypothetical protein NIES593_06200 [Hydrococcus rivularis NIES-593]